MVNFFNTKFQNKKTLKQNIKEMKSFYITTVLFFGITFFNISAINAQTESSADKMVYKTSVKNTPEKVKETLKDYSGYKISNEVTYSTKNKATVYRFKMEKGNWTHYLLINEKGKVIGIDDGENPKS